jgi:HK97 family phage major capsid protein
MPVIRTENIAFATGAATNADPFQGLGQMSGFTSQASTAALVDDLIEAVFELVVAKRPPNAAFVPVRLAKKIRKLKASTGGSYLFEPDEPLAIAYGPDDDDTVPIIPLDGLPNTAGSVAYIGDFSKLVVLQRLMPNGKLLMAAESPYGGTFVTDSITIRLTERMDMAVIPGYEPSFIKLTGIDAS